MINVEACSAPEMNGTQSVRRFMAAGAKEVPGGETVITRLADIRVIQAIRSWIAQVPAAQTEWFEAPPRRGPAEQGAANTGHWQPRKPQPR